MIAPAVDEAEQPPAVPAPGIRFPLPLVLALVPWTILLCAHWIATTGRVAAVMGPLRPYWPTSRVPSLAVAGVVWAAVTGWTVIGLLGERLRWLAAAQAVAAVAAVAWWWTGPPPPSLWSYLLDWDGFRVIGALLAAAALAALGRLLPSRLRGLLLRAPVAVWALVLLALALGAFTSARLEIASVMLVNLAAWAVGHRLVQRLRFRAGLVSGALVAWLTGLAVLGLLGYGLALAGLWYRWVALLALAALAAACWPSFADLRRLLELRIELPAWTLPEWMAAALSAVMLGVASIASLAPEVFADAVSHHLALADRIAREHRLAFWPQWNATAQINHGAVLYAWGTVLSTAVAGKIQNFAFALAIPLLMAALARRWLGGRAALWGYAIWSASSLAGWLSSTAYVDVPSAAYGLGAALVLLSWLEAGGRGTAALAGVLVGSLMAMKFVGYTFAVPIGLWVLAGRTGVTNRERWRSVAAFSAAAAAVCLPWYLRSYLLTGNPVFPVLNTVFRSPLWESNDVLAGVRAQFGEGRTPAALARLPWMMTFHPERLVEVGAIGPPLLALLPLAAAIRGWTPGMRRLLLLAALTTACWAAGIHNLRWFVMQLPLWGLIAGAAVVALHESLRSRWIREVAAATVVSLLLVTVVNDLLGRSWWFHGASQAGLPYTVAFGVETRDAYLRRASHGYEALRHIESRQRGARVLSWSVRERLYESTLTDGDVAAVLPLRRKAFSILRAPDARSAWMGLRRERYDYLLVGGGTTAASGPGLARFTPFRGDFIGRFAELEYAHRGIYALRVLDAPRPTPLWPANANRLHNGGFERLDDRARPRRWSSSAAVFVDDTGARAHGGRVAVRIGAGASDGALAAHLPASGPAPWILALNARSASGRQGTASVILRWLDAAGALAGEWRFLYFPGADWDEFFQADTPPPGAAQVQLLLGTVDPVWIDDVSFAPNTRADVPRGASAR